MPKDRTLSQRQPSGRSAPYGPGPGAAASLDGSNSGKATKGAAKLQHEMTITSDKVIEELISSVDVLVGQVAELNDKVKQAHSDVSKQLSAEQVHLLQEAALAKLEQAASDSSKDTKSTTMVLTDFLDHVTSSVPIGVDDRIAYNSLLNAAETAVAHLAATGSLPPSEATSVLSDVSFSLTRRIGPKHLVSLLLDSLPASPSGSTTAHKDETKAPLLQGSFTETLNTVLESHLDLASQLAAQTEQRDALAAEIRELVTQLRTSSTDEPEACAAIISSAESAAEHAVYVHLASQLETLTADSRVANEELVELESNDHLLLAALESQTADLNTAAGIHAALVESLTNSGTSPSNFAAALASVMQQANMPLADIAAGFVQAAAHVNQLEPEAPDMSALKQMPPMDVCLAGSGRAEFADVSIQDAMHKWVAARERREEHVGVQRALDHIDARIRAAAAATGVDGALDGSVEQVMERLKGQWTRGVHEIKKANQEQSKMAGQVLQGLERAVDVEHVVRERSNMLDGVGWSAVLGLDDKIMERKRALGSHTNGFQGS
ncbi:hypothetical protein BCR44DRAFT_90801 [Catenaria anguillulae PL171]|uniref:Uncharacterized protein n=1 Tax=Catenaria anguillulae PL171 TaxID=765915 RepID=A0A1Y2HU62_9FUNG|nr:hypothetical protein BCR44DRAFT_90801 [Catenaria anguillulae PL171]